MPSYLIPVFILILSTTNHAANYKFINGKLMPVTTQIALPDPIPTVKKTHFSLTPIGTKPSKPSPRVNFVHQPQTPTPSTINNLTKINTLSSRIKSCFQSTTSIPFQIPLVGDFTVSTSIKKLQSSCMISIRHTSATSSGQTPLSCYPALNNYSLSIASNTITSILKNIQNNPLSATADLPSLFSNLSELNCKQPLSADQRNSLSEQLLDFFKSSAPEHSRQSTTTDSLTNNPTTLNSLDFLDKSTKSILKMIPEDSLKNMFNGIKDSGFLNSGSDQKAEELQKKLKQYLKDL